MNLQRIQWNCWEESIGIWEDLSKGYLSPKHFWKNISGTDCEGIKDLIPLIFLFLGETWYSNHQNECVFPQGNPPSVGRQVWERLLKWQREKERGGTQRERERRKKKHCERKAERKVGKVEGGKEREKEVLWVKKYNRENIWLFTSLFFFFSYFVVSTFILTKS